MSSPFQYSTQQSSSDEEEQQSAYFRRNATNGISHLKTHSGSKDHLNKQQVSLSSYSFSDSFTCPSLTDSLRSHGARIPDVVPRFRLQMRQEPEHGLAIGIEESAYRNARNLPLDPPPICELIQESSSGVTQRCFISVPEVCVQARLVSEAWPFYEIVSSGSAVEPMISGLIESGFIAPISSRQEECLFVFPELGIRQAGQYRIRFDLLDRTRLQVFRLVSIYSEPFTIVAERKDFAGLQPSTPLVHSLVQRGFKLRLIREEKARKGGKKQKQQMQTYNDQHNSHVDSYRSRPFAFLSSSSSYTSSSSASTSDGYSGGMGGMAARLHPSTSSFSSIHTPPTPIKYPQDSPYLSSSLPSTLVNRTYPPPNPAWPYLQSSLAQNPSQSARYNDDSIGRPSSFSGPQPPPMPFSRDLSASQSPLPRARTAHPLQRVSDTQLREDHRSRGDGGGSNSSSTTITTDSKRRLSDASWTHLDTHAPILPLPQLSSQHTKQSPGKNTAEPLSFAPEVRLTLPPFHSLTARSHPSHQQHNIDEGDGQGRQ